MSAAAIEPRPWTGRARLGFVLIIFLLQLAFIFWLGTVSPARPRGPGRVPGLRLVTAPSELLALSDASLFALPHQRGFSGAAWLQLPRPSYQPPEVTEPERWLPLSADRLGLALQRFVQTNGASAPTLAAWVPVPGVPPLSKVEPPPVRSGVRVQGALPGVPEGLGKLPAWPYTDLLSDTVIQVTVDPRGRALSAAVLSGSGLTAADQLALERVRVAKFAALPGADGPETAAPISTLRWGQVIFHWQTLPATNPAAKAP